MSSGSGIRNLVIVLGDQLDPHSAAFDGFDPQRDRVWMAEVAHEATHVWSHKLRIAAFVAAMRHHRDSLRNQGKTVLYTEMGSDAAQDRGSSLSHVLAADVRRHQPRQLILVQPGAYRVQQELSAVANDFGIPLELRTDRHFYTTPQDFRDWQSGRRAIVLEAFYRHMRRREGILLEPDGSPTGGHWNFDKDNRKTFGTTGPPAATVGKGFPPDAVSRDVIRMVQRRFSTHPGSLEHFDLPTTPQQAKALLQHFVSRGLPSFGPYQDAMWRGEPFLYHSRLSFPLNLKLLSPGECIDAAVAAYTGGHASIASVEGFVRQILGWREFVRGVYWTYMPQYAEHNALECASLDVPQAFWDGKTAMACVADATASLIRHGYTHHIQRLMVLGLLAMLLGVHPKKFNQWHLAMYVDAVDWVSLPNALGMSQHADGGLLATKPYAASGRYIDRMSNYCRQCPYDPKRATGENACPFNSLYWDFLARHEPKLRKNGRMGFQLKNLQRKSRQELRDIRARAEQFRGATASGARF